MWIEEWNLGSEVEVVERHKVALQETGQEAEVDTVGELAVQLGHLQVDLVQMLVDKGDKALLDHLELVWGVVEQGVKGVALTPHTDIVVVGGELLRDDPMGKDALPLGHDDHVHNNILREADGSPEVPGEGD